MKKAFILTLLFLGVIFTTQAQKVWTLEECVEYAFDNNLILKQWQNAESMSEINLKQNRLNRLPTLNASMGENFNFGKSIDPATNTFENQGFNSFNVGANTGVTVFQGFSKQNRVKQSLVDLEASRLDYDKAQNDIALSIVQGYLNILFNREQLNTFLNRSELTKLNIEQTNKLIRAGALPASEIFTLDAQFAQDEVNIITARNTMDLAMLDLQLQLELDPSQPFEIDIPEIPVPSIQEANALNIDEIINVAINNQPDIQSSDSQVKSAELGVEIAKGSLYPSLNVFGGISTNQVSLAKQLVGLPTSIGLIPTQFETQSGEAILQEGFIFNTEKISFGDQLDQNLGQNFGASLSIPIFNGSSSRLGVERAKINLYDAQIRFDQAKKTLKQTLYRAYSDAKAASIAYQASEKNKVALNKVFLNTEKKFKLGASTALEFNTARDNLISAESTLLQNKYDFYFKLKILDFYQGKPIIIE